MVEAVLNIKQWGNNLGVRLPARWRRKRICHVDRRARIGEGDQVVITPVGASRFTLEQRLAAYDPKRHGGEQMATTKRWAPNVGSRETSGGGQTQALVA